MKAFSDRIPVVLLAVVLVAGCTAAPSPTPLTSPTGISYVDGVIEAVQSGDPQAFKSLIVLRSVPCTTERGLLRQPLCPEGEVDGALIQTLPMLSADLGHLTIEEIESWRGIGEADLYAVYRTGPYTYADEFFPAGEIAVAFLPEGSDFAFIFQVTQDGIVRIDYCGIQYDICQGSTIAEIFQEHASAFILGPLPVGE